MTRTALILTTEGQTRTVSLEGPDGTLKVLQAAVGGWVEPIDMNALVTMWIHEEGKLGGFEPNPGATVMFNETFGVLDVVMGDVIFTGGTDDEGNTLGLPETLRVILIELFASMDPVPDAVRAALKAAVDKYN